MIEPPAYTEELHKIHLVLGKMNRGSNKSGHIPLNCIAVEMLPLTKSENVGNKSRRYSFEQTCFFGTDESFILPQPWILFFGNHECVAEKSLVCH
jgi:hypothetical protein